ncbi:putative ABC transport system ATP-binding protein [Alkalihalobacillus xiaoxiensis]|uniref:Putative hemin import ATP-binding protein HrtA n=1 Tax=Shouchella xiaoxiensis TaxID=766895 RepID=A0ABS2SY56_9BACI|nr:ABC transporter ATP-binding protein [Shouchella xiaoxiensis]MBM7839700.1 putative ABC transport system ATP-binding protein [Shouchella xiaoxiensis]
MTTMLDFQGVTKSFGDGEGRVDVLKSIQLSVKSGELVCITGPSGSGKSTMLSLAGALLSPSSGTIKINGKDLSKLDEKARSDVRLNQIGFIFQSAHLLPYLKVEDQLLYIAKLAKMERKQAKERTAELLDSLGMSHRAKQYPVNLSGGEKQRVAIARAWMINPDLILADEPTASLDAKRAREVVETLAKEVKAKDKAAVMITHDQRMFDLCDRVIVIEDGKITTEHA